jgi:hypothetical protein
VHVNHTNATSTDNSTASTNETTTKEAELASELEKERAARKELEERVMRLESSSGKHEHKKDTHKDTHKKDGTHAHTNAHAHEKRHHGHGNGHGHGHSRSEGRSISTMFVVCMFGVALFVAGVHNQELLKQTMQNLHVKYQVYAGSNGKKGNKRGSIMTEFLKIV